MRRTVLPLLLAVAAQATLTGASLAIPAPQDGSQALRSWLRGPESLLLVAGELALLEQVPDDGTAEEFVRWFWQRRDPDPDTTVNEFRADFAERLSHVEREFAEPGRPLPGWQTAKGHVYMILGQPYATYESFRNYFVDGALRALEIWEYRRRLDGVRFAFAETDTGTRIIVSDPQQRLSADQEEYLEAARRRVVQDESLPAFATVADHRDETLLAEVDAGYRAGGVLARVRLSLRELMGELDDDTLTYRLQILAVERGAEAPEELGVVDIRLELDELGGAAGQLLDLALWFEDPLGSVGSLRVVEVFTGRTATLNVAADTTLPTEFAVARELALLPLRRGTGMVVAYLPTCEKRPVAVARLVVPEEAPQLGGTGVAEPALLALLRLESPQPR